MRVHGTLLAAIILVESASPAAAWWDYAKWGLTPQQRSSASKGGARPCDGAADCVAPFRNASPTMTAGGLKIAGQSATALFDFDAQGKLQATFLVFGSRAIGLLNDALAGTYGAPVSIDNSWPATRVWRDVAKGTIVKSWSFPDSNKIIIEYRPAPKGL